MPLLSKFFRGDKKLEAAQVSDPAHLVHGTVGPHVAKVQMALFAIDSLSIDRGEVKLQTYGPSTARAVLAYKSKRQIINRAYQNRPDDIVGKMTITRLDQDMLQWELSHRHVGECRKSSVGRSGLAFGQAQGGLVTRSLLADGRTVKPQLNRALRIVCAITKRASIEDGYPIARHIQRARDILFEFGLTLSVEFKEGFVDTVDFPQTLVIEDDVALLRQAWENTRPGLGNILRVIVCQGPINGNLGETFRNVTVGSNRFPPFAVLNSRNKVPNVDTTLLHEMIHAANNGPISHDPEPFSVFFSHASPSPGSIERRMLKEEHAIQLSRSFFAV
jgi:hypothetical protein